jgi:hypothetical protein
MSIVRDIGRGLYNLFIGIAIVAFLGGTLAIANYAVTLGTGTNFGSIVVGGVHYAQQLLCDPTTPSQCQAVSAGGAARVDGSAVTQPISGTVTANAGTNLNTSALSTSANQSTEIASLATIVTNTGASVPAGTNVIGGVTIPGGIYNTIAVSQTAQVLTGGSGGATGDYLSHCVIYPTSTTIGVVTVFDNTSSAANNAIAFAGGTLSNISPILIPVGAFSVNGAWKVTTGAAAVTTCYGKFH